MSDMDGISGMDRIDTVGGSSVADDERWREKFYSTGLDVSSRAGFLLGAYYTGLSLQPNLLSRGTRDQAIVSGVAASVGYAWGVSAHSFLRSTADRLPMAATSQTGRAVSGVLVDVVAAAVGTVVMRALPPREHEGSRRALIRLGGVGLAAAGLAGVGADSLRAHPRQAGVPRSRRRGGSSGHRCRLRNDQAGPGHPRCARARGGRGAGERRPRVVHGEGTAVGDGGHGAAVRGGEG